LEKYKKNKMKIVLLVMLSVSCVLPRQEKNELFGKWKIVKVETGKGVLIPTMDFFLTISEDTFGFNRDANGCSAKPVITDTTIEFEGEICTRMCCDGERDPIGGMNLYAGNYIVNNSSLTIWTEEVKTYFERIH
jgi:hypothetical protein